MDNLFTQLCLSDPISYKTSSMEYTLNNNVFVRMSGSQMFPELTDIEIEESGNSFVMKTFNNKNNDVVVSTTTYLSIEEIVATIIKICEETKI